MISGTLTNLLVPTDSNHVKNIVKVLNSAGVLTVLLHETSIDSKYKRLSRLLNLSLLFLCTKKLQAENVLTQLLDLNNILTNVTPILNRDDVTKQEVEEMLEDLQEHAKSFETVEWNWFTKTEVDMIKSLHSWVLQDNMEKSVLMDHLMMIDRVDNNTRKQIKFLDALISLFKNVLINCGTQYGGLTESLTVETKFKDSYIFYIKIFGLPEGGIFDPIKIEIIESEYTSFNIVYDTFDFNKFTQLVIDEYNIRISLSA